VFFSVKKIRVCSFIRSSQGLLIPGVRASGLSVTKVSVTSVGGGGAGEAVGPIFYL
jgi:hypothetical protein